MTRQTTDKLLTEISQAISDNSPLSKKLPDGSFLHLDRQLPFLCVYRGDIRGDIHGEMEGSPKAMESLLRGTPAYLLVNEHPARLKTTRALLVAIIEKLGDYFDQICLLELWSSAPQQDASLTPEFEILASSTGTPVKFLEEFENALLHITVDNLKANIEIGYQQNSAPPGLEPILTRTQLTALNCIPVGLAIKPVYLDVKTAEVLPFHLQDLHQGLTRALKRGFYAFAHHHTHIRPRHFHELGNRSITKAVWQTDRRLAEISATFDLLLYVSPVNSSAAWQEFEASDYEREASFLYRARNVNPSLLKRQLFQIPIEAIEDPTLAHIFSEKRNELDRQITLVADRNTERFLLGSRQIYGDVEPELLEQAHLLLEAIDPSQPTAQNDYLAPQQIAERARLELDKYREQDPSLKSTVSVRGDVPGILVSQGNLLIGQDASVLSSRINALISHEVGTHIVTHHNGGLQPFRELSVGMASYEELQEGLAVLAEYLVGELSPSRLRTLAARVLAVDCITSGASFIDCFRVLYRDHGFHPHTAFNITMRIFRGGGYTKDIVYLRGLKHLLEALADGYPLESLYLGKISHQHLDFVEELQWRQILQPPTLTPTFLDSPEAEPRLQALSNGLTLTDLIKE